MEENREIREFEIRKLQLITRDNSGQSTRDHNVRARAPKLPEYRDNVDNMDSYLERFERFATSQHWDRNIHGPSISVLY